MVILIFEGENKSGKTTLIKSLHKNTKYMYTTIDRFSLSSYCFGKAKHRNVNYNTYLYQDLTLWNEAILIFLYTNKRILKKRFAIHNEKDINLNTEYLTMKKLYNEYLNITPLYTIKINTSNCITNCIKNIKLAVKQFNNESLDIKINRLINAITKFGNIIENTKELQNVQLKFETINIKHLKYDESQLVTEKDDYNKIYYTLKNTINAKLNYYKTQNINSRQFIYLDDSCISLYQLLQRNDILYANITLRSSNVKKLLLLDCIALSKIANKLNKQYFHCTNIKYNINILSAHIIMEK